MDRKEAARDARLDEARNRNAEPHSERAGEPDAIGGKTMRDGDIRFGEIRKYCSRIDRVSICVKETLCYENFEYIHQVPDTYDELYLYGFGIILSEFPGENGLRPLEWLGCLEFMLSITPRKDA